MPARRSRLHPISNLSSTARMFFAKAMGKHLNHDQHYSDEGLAILGMKRDELTCVYCGDEGTHMDHLFAVTKDKNPSGYITQPCNLVPCCGTCSSSRSDVPWQDWIKNPKVLSPVRRKKTEGLEGRIQRLQEFMAWGWGDLVQFDYQKCCEENPVWARRKAEAEENLRKALKELDELANEVGTWKDLPLKARPHPTFTSLQNPIDEAHAPDPARNGFHDQSGH